jgi:hypothetical protein
MLERVLMRLRRIGGMGVEAQAEMVAAVRAWLEGRPRRGVRYWTDGKSVYYFESEVLKRTPRGVAISNQGWVTPTTNEVLNTILQELRLKARVFIRGGEMYIEDTDTEEVFAFPSGRNKWVEFAHDGRLVRKGLVPVELEEIERRTRERRRELKRIVNDILMQIKLAESVEDIWDIEIPELGIRFEDLFYDCIYPRRMIYTGGLKWILENMPDLLFRDIEYCIKKSFQKGR